MSRLIELRRLSAGYDGVAVVWDVDLHVDEGEVVALLGPNGAGKTTTLLTISGLLPVIAGEVSVLGAPPATRRPHSMARRGLGHVPEDRALFTDLTTRENLRLGGARHRQQVDNLLELLPPLAPLLDRKAGLLSGGEQQMLAIARALASEPRVLLVDELSLGLAPVVVERLAPVLRRVADDRGTAVILVEQHIGVALSIADRAYVLQHGRVVLDGAAAALAQRRDVLAMSYMGDDAGAALDR
jgi:branched-chain amino acid transport system ATP-binding protein